MTKKNEYSVVLYTTIKVRIPGIRTASQIAACKAAEDRFAALINHVRQRVNLKTQIIPGIEYIELDEEGIEDYMVDEVGDENFDKSKFYDASYKQVHGPASNRAVFARNLAISLKGLLGTIETAKDSPGDKWFSGKEVSKAKELFEKAKDYFPELYDSISELKTEPSEALVALRNLMLDLEDSGDNMHPETEEEYASCKAAREVLDAFYPMWRQQEVDMPQAATEEETGDPAITAYIKSGGLKCMICGSRNIDSSNGNTDSNYTTFNCECKRCGSTWEEIYTLSGVANLVKGSKKK